MAKVHSDQEILPNRLGFKTCLSKTKTQQFQDQDFDVQDRDSRLANTGSP